MKVVTIEQKGGTGSGHHGHAGLPGIHGGSRPGTGGVRKISTDSQNRERRAKLWRKKALDGRIGPTKNGQAPPLHDSYYKYKSDERAEKVLNTTHDLGYGVTWYKQGSSVVRGNVKDAIVTQLAADTGLEYDKVNEAIGTWALTSNDDDAYALQLQKAAADEFGLELSEWQNNKMNTSGDVPSWIGATMDNAEQRTFLRTMYANTQANFAKQGFSATDTITLYRGFRMEGSKELVPHLGKEIDWQGNAIESWSSSRSVAGNFGNNIIAMEVPIRNIIGSCVTGFGCLAEAEFVVAGTKGNKARIIRAGNYSIGEEVPEYVLSEISEGLMD